MREGGRIISRGVIIAVAANEEMKRRSDVVGIFSHDGAIVRLVGALMLQSNHEWSVARRYMSLETLARLTDTPTVRLTSVAS